MPRTEANITPDLLEWARLRNFPTVQSAADSLHIPVDQLDSWERGKLRPTLSQAQSLASRLHIPFGYLFLTSPPTDILPLPDLRTVAGASPSAPSPDFLDVILDAQRKQAWYREELLVDNVPPLEFVGRFTIDSPMVEIAMDIAATVGVDDDMRRNAESWETFLVDFIRKTETIGILVLRAGVAEGNNNRKLSVDEFRGFAISDDRAPLIFINSKDAKTAQIFTLAHELAHIWVNESGISNPDYRTNAVGQINDIERLCNRVAAETLLPTADFLLSWNDKLNVTANLLTLTRRYRVSAIAILRQAYDLGKVDADIYWEFYLRERGKRAPKRTGRGGDFYNTFFARNSRTFTSAVVSAVAVGRISHIDAATLLNVKGQTIGKVAAQMFGGQ